MACLGELPWWMTLCRMFPSGRIVYGTETWTQWGEEEDESNGKRATRKVIQRGEEEERVYNELWLLAPSVRHAQKWFYFCFFFAISLSLVEDSYEENRLQLDECGAPLVITNCGNEQKRSGKRLLSDCRLLWFDEGNICRDGGYSILNIDSNVSKVTLECIPSIFPRRCSLTTFPMNVNIFDQNLIKFRFIFVVVYFILFFLSSNKRSICNHRPSNQAE